MLGQDVVATRCGATFAELAAREGVAVTVTWRHPDAYPNDDPHYVGHPGLGALPAVTETLTQADLWIVIGDRLDENTTGGYSLPKPGTDVAHVYLDAGHLEPRGRGIGVLSRADVVADALLAASRANPAEAPPARVAWAAQRRAAWEHQATPQPRAVREGFVDQFSVALQMRDLMPEGAVFVTDAGNFSSYAARYLRWTEPGTFVGPVSGAMGYAVPAALGAKLARPDRPVVGVCGDGGFLMTAVDLETAVREDVPFVLVLFDNSRYGTIRMHQERHYPGRPIATTLGDVDFVALVESLGAKGYAVTHLDEFAPAFIDAVACGRPAVIVVRIDPEQIAVSMYDKEFTS